MRRVREYQHVARPGAREQALEARDHVRLRRLAVEEQLHVAAREREALDEKLGPGPGVVHAPAQVAVVAGVVVDADAERLPGHRVLLSCG
jgi:hypothetical protein